MYLYSTFKCRCIDILTAPSAPPILRYTWGNRSEWRSYVFDWVLLTSRAGLDFVGAGAAQIAFPVSRCHQRRA